VELLRGGQKLGGMGSGWGKDGRVFEKASGRETRSD
jgi:hypothetical protein